MLKITSLNNQQKLLIAAANKLNSLFAISINDKLPTLFLSSGGSALNILDNIDHSLLSPYLTIGVLDERLKASQEDSNFFKLSQTKFFKQAQLTGAKFKNEVNDNANNFKKIYITQGIGEDGHTAGLFPNDKPDNAFPSRVSVSFNFLKENVDISIVYAVGEGKKEALKKTLAPSGSREETPARIIQEMKQVYLFTDQKF